MLLSAAKSTMNARRFVLYLLLNALVSVSATWAALWLWDRFVVSRPTSLALSVASATPTTEVVPDFPALIASPLPTPPPAAPTLHMVQSGETLGAIARLYGVSIEDLMRANNLSDPNVLAIGQQLVIPMGGPDPTPTAVVETSPLPPLATATPNPNAPAPQLTIRAVQSPGRLEAEVVTIANSGGPVDLAGWMLRDEAGRGYIFPALTLFEGGIVNVHTRAGQDTVVDLYWGQTEAVWAPGKWVLLQDPDGNLGARLVVP